MKPVVADYRFRCYCVRIECLDGTIVRLTDYPRDLVIGADTYQSDNGYQFTGSQSGANLSPGVMDLEGVLSVTGITRDQVQSGVFDNARLYCFATTWDSPTEDEEEVGCAILGKATLEDNRYRIEMMALVDALNQSVGRTYKATCDKVFGGQDFAGCKFDLATVTVTGTLTSVVDSSNFTDSVRAEAADYFSYGTISFTTGDNAGLPAIAIKSFGTGGVIQTFDPLYYPPAIGDQYVLVPGCRKRLADCRDKWNNVVNFGGFSFVPTSSTYGQIGNK